MVEDFSMKYLNPSDGASGDVAGLPSRCSWLYGGGVVGARIAACDWAKTPLGPIAFWPHALRNTLNLILNSELSMLIAWGPELRCFYNDAYAPIVDGKGDVLGSPFIDVFPEAWDQVGSIMDKALEGESLYFGEHCVRLLRNGTMQDTWWVFSYSPIIDEKGQICGVFAPVHEITDKMAVLASLRKSEANLQIVSDLVPGMLWRSTHEGEIVWSNNNMKAFFGTTQMGDAIHPDDQASVWESWEQARAKASTYQHHHRLKGPDGEYRWYFASSEPRIDEQGEVVEWYGVATDIHDLHTALNALSESEALFNSFASNSGSVIWMADAATLKLDYLSSAFSKIWGHPPEGNEVTWAYRLATVHPDDRFRQERTLEELLQGEVLHEEYRIVRQDGSVRWIRDTMFPIFTTGGLIHKIGGIAQDITRENSLIVHLIDDRLDHRNIIAQQLRALDYEIRVFPSVESFLRVQRAVLPGCVVYLDHDGADEAKRLASALSGQKGMLPLVLVRDVADPAEAICLMKQGASDIVLATDPPARLVQAIATVLATMEDIVREGDAVQDAMTKTRGLTDRERDILVCLSNGGTNKMIGRDLGISPRTVETYRMRILERLGVTTVPAAVKIAAIAGL